MKIISPGNVLICTKSPQYRYNVHNIHGGYLKYSIRRQGESALYSIPLSELVRVLRYHHIESS